MQGLRNNESGRGKIVPGLNYIVLINCAILLVA